MLCCANTCFVSKFKIINYNVCLFVCLFVIIIIIMIDNNFNNNKYYTMIIIAVNDLLLLLVLLLQLKHKFADRKYNKMLTKFRKSIYIKLLLLLL